MSSSAFDQYEVLCIGIPKSGTNATEKACRYLGARPSPHMHTANYHLAEDHKVAYVYRNPRNVLISAQRYQNHQMRGWENTITDEKLIAQFFDFFNASMPAVYRSYAKWWITSAYLIRFEELFQPHMENQAVLNGLADYLEQPRRPWDHAYLIGGTPTWTGKLSQWEDFWTPAIDKVWREEGMIEIERSLGYNLDS